MLLLLLFTEDFLKTGSKGPFICSICAAPGLGSNPHIDVIFFTNLSPLKSMAPSMEIKWEKQNLGHKFGDYILGLNLYFRLDIKSTYPSDFSNIQIFFEISAIE